MSLKKLFLIEKNVQQLDMCSIFLSAIIRLGDIDCSEETNTNVSYKKLISVI